jgi:hypothetical protein
MEQGVCFVEVARCDTGPELWRVRGVRHPNSLEGSLVIVSQENKKMLHIGVGVYDIAQQVCQRGHGSLRLWNRKPPCWTCGWPFKSKSWQMDDLALGLWQQQQVAWLKGML